MDELTLSIVSHGHGVLLRNLLADLNRFAGFQAPNVILTLNVPESLPDSSEYPRLKISVIRNTTPKGFGANHNVAFSHCTTRWFAVLNPDLRIEAEVFAPLISVIASDNSGGVVTPRIVNSAKLPEDHVRANLTPASLWRRHRGKRREQPPAAAVGSTCRPRPFFWVAGMFMLFRAEAFRRIGGFDERYFLYCEDFDVCARLYNANYAIMIAPQVHAVHDAQRGSHRSARYLRWHVSSLLKVWLSRAYWQVTLGSRGSHTSSKVPTQGR